MKKALLIFAIAATLFQTLQAQQYTLTDGDVVVENGIIQSCSYNFAIKDIIIPDTLDGQAVTGISNNVFEDRNITSVKFPSTLLSIEYKAFYQNFELTQIDLQSCTKLISIGYYAFTWSQMDTVDLSLCTSLRSIDRYAFRNSLLARIYLPVCEGYENYGWKDSENNSYMGGDFVDDWSGFYYVDYPYTLSDEDLVVVDGMVTACGFDFLYKNIAIPENIDGQTIIGIIDKTDTTNGVFQKKGLFNIHLPETIKTIGWGAFAENYLTTLQLSHCTQLHNIGESAFSGNEILSLEINGCNELTNIGASAFNGNQINNLNLGGFSSLTNINSNAFKGSDIANLNLSDCESLTYIGVNAFYGNNITNLDLSDCVALSIIDEGAFWSNNIDTLNLSGCTLLTQINNAAFAYNGIKHINFGEASALKTIGEQAFKYSAIDVLDLSPCSELQIINNEAFANSNIISLDLMPCTSLMTIGENAFNENDFSSFVLPLIDGFVADGWCDLYNNTYNAGDSVSDFASFYCVNNAYTFTSDDLEVEDGMIVGCSYDFARNYIRIPQTIGRQTITGIANASVGIFQGKEIYILELPETIEYIGTRAFANNNLRNVDFSNVPNLSEIGKEAFYENNIDTVDFSPCPGLTYIGIMSFQKNNIKALNLDGCGALTIVDHDAFMENKIKNLDLSDCTALTNIGQQAFSDNKLTAVDFSGCTSLTRVGYSAFFFNNITSVDFSNCTNLEVIANGAFYSNFISSLDLSGCTNLTRIEMEAFHTNSLSSVDLSNCTALVIIGWFAFEWNNMSSFTLPTPDYPGFEYWQDVHENPYNAGEIVSVDKEYRAMNVYSPLTFSISHGTEPIDSAMISFYTSEYYTDENGIKSFPKILQGTYSYTISAEGYDDASGELELGVDSLTVYVNMSGNSISEIENDNIHLYPNPGISEIFIEVPPQAEGALLEIFNSHGKIVLQQQINYSPLRLSSANLNPGFYFFTVCNQDAEVLKSGKWIKW